MYQFDSTYDQEVPHMYPQVKQTFSRLQTLYISTPFINDLVNLFSPVLLKTFASRTQIL